MATGCDHETPYKDYCKAHKARLRVHGDLQEHIPLRVYLPSRRGMDRKEWQKKYNNDRLVLVREWVNKYKVEAGCTDCGWREHPCALDFDHTDGKTANISSLRSVKAIEEEIARHKCVVRCANCHRIVTYERLSLDVSDV